MTVETFDPDIEVSYTFNDYMEQRDPVMDKIYELEKSR